MWSRSLVGPGDVGLQSPAGREGGGGELRLVAVVAVVGTGAHSVAAASLGHKVTAGPTLLLVERLGLKKQIT